MAEFGLPTVAQCRNHFAAAAPVDLGANTLIFPDNSSAEMLALCLADDADAVALLWIDVIATTGGATIEDVTVNQSETEKEGVPVFDFESSAAGTLSLRAQWLPSATR